MSTTEEQQYVTDPDEPKPIRIPVTAMATAIWRRRRLLAIVTGIGFICAVAIALMIPNEYESTAKLMPPDPQALSNTSVLGVLTGQVSIAGSTAGGLFNTHTPSATMIGILGSRTEQDYIVDHFDLRHVYRKKLYVDARNFLADRTTIVEDKRNGIIDIAVTDRDRYRARDMVRAYIEELNTLLNTSSTSSARREREFLEDRLKSIKTELDDTARALSSFSSRNATLDYQRQGEATVDSAIKLKDQLITAESELSALKSTYADNNVRVRGAQARIDELQSQLWKIGGEGENLDNPELKDNQLFPSVRELPLLGATYYDLSQQVAVKEALYETLTKQYEMAKVEEAKEIPAVKMLDEPELPERKSWPHRSIIVILGALVSAFVGAAWIIACKLWEITVNSHPLKAAGLAVARSFRRHDAAC